MLPHDSSLRSTFGRFRFAFALTLLSLATTVSVVEAQTTSTWIGGTSGSWFNASNWDTGVVPNDTSSIPSNDVVIDGDDTVNATARLSTDGTTRIRSLSIGAGDNLLVDEANGDTQLSIEGSDQAVQNTLSNQGTISVTSDLGSFFSGSSSLLLTNNIDLTGGGAIQLTDSELLFSDSFRPDAVVNNVDNQIQGSGVINLTNATNFTNSTSGLISANESGNQLRIRDSFADVNFTNEGTLRATNGGQLSFHIDVANTDSGVIEALDGSTVLLERGASVIGGVLRTDGSGLVNLSANVVSPLNTFQTNEVTFDNVVLDANINLERGAILDLRGVIDNRKTITTDEIADFFGSPNTISVDGEVTLTGGGTIDLVEAGFGFPNQGFGGTDSVTNENNTIQGSGSIAGTLINEEDGLVIANRNFDQLNIEIVGGQSTFNRGTFRAENGGILNLRGGSGDGFVNDGGVIEALDDSVVAISNVTGGTLRSVGSGSVDVIGRISDLTLEGSINSFGGSTTEGDIDNRGSITVNGDLGIRGGVTLDGGGTVVLSPNRNSRIIDSTNLFFGQPADAPDVLTNVDNTIRGDGIIGSERLQVINEAGGTIEADGTLALAQSLLNQPLINRGTLRAGADSTLLIDGRDFFAPDPTEINNDGGLIEALAGGQVDITRSVITGGTLSTVGDGILSVGDNSFNQGVTRINDATVSGNIQFIDSEGRLEFRNFNTTGVNFSDLDNNPFSFTGGTISFIGDTSLDDNATIGLAGNNVVITDFLNDDVGDLLNTNSTIAGFGIIDYQTQDFINEADGVVNANVDGRSLALFTGSADNNVINRGVLRASNSGELIISGGVNDFFNNLEAGILDNTDGRIEAVSTSVVRILGDAVVNGGEIVGDSDSRLILGDPSSGNFSSSPGSLNNVTLDLAAELAGGSAFGLEGQIVNQQSIAVPDTSNLVINGDTTLSGGGTVQLAVNGMALDVGNESHTLTNLDNTIEGFGEIGSSSSNLRNLSIVNETAGVIQANVTNQTLTINTRINPLVNRGTLRASSGGTLELLSFGLLDSNVTNDGIIESQARSTVFGDGLLVNGVDGTLQGDGTIEFDSFLNEGTISPGLVLGVLTLDSREVELASSSLLDIDLMGTEDGEFDVLNVLGSLGLGGDLSVDLSDFTPTFDDEFRIATADQFFGAFDNVAFGERLTSADGQFDFLVSLDQSSLTPSLLLSNFQAISVPEPGSATLVGLTFFAIAARRRRSS